MWEDFDKGHVAGARNVPYYLSVTPHGKEKNPQFVEQVSALYAKDQNLIVVMPASYIVINWFHLPLTKPTN